MRHRLFIVYNPRSSRFVDVEKEVLSKVRKIDSYIIGKYEVENVNENNIDNLLRNNNVMSLVIDNARVLAGKRSISKEINY